MILPHPKDAIHKSWLYAILSAIADDAHLPFLLRFKGGTCAAMRGILPRFSVDLDFDLLYSRKVAFVQKRLVSIFIALGLKIKDQSRTAPQFFLGYENAPGERSTLKVDVTFPPNSEDEYEPVRFVDIDRILHAHTIPTMFAHKLLATMGRFQKKGALAGRDLLDLYIFFRAGLPIQKEIIEKQMNMAFEDYLATLGAFVEKYFTQRVIDEDLNALMPPQAFSSVRRNLKSQVLVFLKDAARHSG